MKDKILKVIKYPSDKLLVPTVLWDFNNHTEKELIDVYLQLVKALHQFTPKGVALAANQIGLQHRMFVLEPTFALENQLPPLIVNPVIFPRSEDINEDQEGCLSFPSVKLQIRRFESINVSFQDILGLEMDRQLIGWPARVFQHEIEHLDGKTFLDNISKDERREVWKKMAKMKGGLR